MHTEPTASMSRALVWMRRDLRVQDHAALYHALRAARQVWCVFVFDRDILDPLIQLGQRADRRVEFIRDSLLGVDAELQSLAASHGTEGVRLLVRHGWAHTDIPALAAELSVQAVFANHDDEPQSLARDARVRGRLADLGVALHTSKDHVVFERGEVLTQSSTPFSVFTPYKNAWLKQCTPFHLKSYPVAHHAAALAAPLKPEPPVPALEDLGFTRTNLHSLRLPTGPAGAQELLDDFLDRIDHYHETRDHPAIKGPSYLSTHLRFGTISIRQLARLAHQRREGGSRGAEVWLSELICAIFTIKSCTTTRGWWAAPSSPSTTASSGSTARMPSACSRLGAKVKPATRWSTRPCTSSTRPATCTTGCAWWWPAS